MLSERFMSDILSDQYITWSDEDRNRIRRRATQTPQRSGTPAAAVEIDPARIADRAVQAMRQAGMQMRRGARTWPQVLPVGEFSGTTAADGLCAEGNVSAGGRVCRQLSPGPRRSGRDLRHQSRVAAPARGALEERHERIAGCPAHCDRCGGGRRTAGQYAGRLARREPPEFVFCGGRR